MRAYKPAQSECDLSLSRPTLGQAEMTSSQGRKLEGWTQIVGPENTLATPEGDPDVAVDFQVKVASD